MRKTLLTISVVLLAAISTQVLAGGELEFRQGISLYKQGQYSAAQIKFEAARQAGMDEPRLDYNLALCYLRLKQYEKAKKYFFEAGRHKPLDGLISFNLGLLELEQGNRDEAIQWFTHVQKTANPKLSALARQRLALLEDIQEPVADSTVWSGGYRLYLGYDDNIEDPAQTGVGNKGDSFISAMAHASRIQDSVEGFRFGMIGFLQHYSTVTVYDLELLQVHLDKGFVAGEWGNRLGVEIEGTSLGGNPYLQTNKLYMSSKLHESGKGTLRLRYRFSTISAISQRYDYLSGSRHELELRRWYTYPDLELQASYELEVNERNDFRGATTFSSYSPTRHTVDLRTGKPLGQQWNLDGRLNWRSSLYGDANILADGSRATRLDHRMILSLELSRAMSENMEISLRYKFTNNQSSLSAFDYTRNIYTLGINGSF